MPTYVSLYNFRKQGIENVEELPDHLDGAVELVDSLGGEITDIYLTLGEYDLVTVSEFPDDEAAARAMLRIGQSGLVSSETLKAWPEESFAELVADLPE
jgi:uncharacterized protein with GYD domain